MRDWHLTDGVSSNDSWITWNTNFYTLKENGRLSGRKEHFQFKTKSQFPRIQSLPLRSTRPLIKDQEVYVSRRTKHCLANVFTACAQFETRCGPYVLKVDSAIKMSAVRQTWNTSTLFTEALRAKVTYDMPQHDIQRLQATEQSIFWVKHDWNNSRNRRNPIT
jgi:hypothetical protein